MIVFKHKEHKENEELNPRKRLSGMRVSPYTDNETQYQNNKRYKLSLMKQIQEIRINYLYKILVK